MHRIKTNPKLGKEICDYLIERGVETPVVANNLGTADKISQIEYHFSSILATLGLDVCDSALIDTPRRVANFMVLDAMHGMDYNAFPKCTTVPNTIQQNNMVVGKHITFNTTCACYFLPMSGEAHIAYIPKDRILRLSKFPRLVSFFSKRPQMQEQLTAQVFHAVEFILNTPDIAIIVNVNHSNIVRCNESDQPALTTTMKFGGCFNTDPAIRSEYFNHVYS